MTKPRKTVREQKQAAQQAETAKQMRSFTTGATRDTAEGKPDFFGYQSHRAMKMFGEYMLAHQLQEDGSMRSSDNWKKGIPLHVYLSSLVRHAESVKLIWEGIQAEARKEGTELTDVDGMINIIRDYEQIIREEHCALWFNNTGLLHELYPIFKGHK